MSDVIIKNVSKKFGSNYVIEGMNLSVEEGELLSLLGPSGCGKSTTLRMLAGFIEPNEGSILIKDKDVTKLPANQRDTAMVFQNYALFPHMTIFDNVAFGLKMKKTSKSEINKQVVESLEMVNLEKYKDRYPSQLSGGQQQRVALARALIVNPNLLLLDEPLSNLDAKLREKMRVEIRKLQQRLGLTTIFVTHDQEEALVLSDRIAVLNEGEIIQVGTPKEIYERPKTRFVADFIGVKNFYSGEYEKNEFRTTNGTLIKMNVNNEEIKEIGIRSNVIIINPNDQTKYQNNFKGVVKDTLYRGSIIELTLNFGENETILAEIPSEQYVAKSLVGKEEVDICWNSDYVLPII